jgi:hypothetical protein
VDKFLTWKLQRDWLKVTALIISRDVVIDYALYGTPELALVANNKAEILQFRGR